jgi:hypothetical protein
MCQITSLLVLASSFSNQLAHSPQSCFADKTVCSSGHEVILSSQRSLHNAPIFRLLLKVAVKGTHQCDFYNFWGIFGFQQWRMDVRATSALYFLCQIADVMLGVRGALMNENDSRLADGHTESNAPDLFRPPKLSGSGPG